MVLSESQAVALLGQFDSLDETVAVDWLVKSLRKPKAGGYHYPERIVQDAIEDGILYVDSVDSGGHTFLGLTKEGEDKWLEYYDEE